MVDAFCVVRPEPIRIWGEFYPEHKAIKFDLTDIQTRTDTGTYLL